MKDYTMNLERQLEQMGFDYQLLQATQNFSGANTCFQYHIVFKDQYVRRVLPQNIGFTFQMQYPDDADFFINSITVDFVSKNNGRTAYRIVYFKKNSGFPTRDQMIDRLLERKNELDNTTT